MKIIGINDKDTGEVLYPNSISSAILHQNIALDSIIDSDMSVIHVSDLGDDTNDGSKNYPLKTFSAAIEMCEYCATTNVLIYLSGNIVIDSKTVVNSTKKIVVVGNEATITTLKDVPFTTTDIVSKSNLTGYKSNTLFVNGSKRFTSATKRYSMTNFADGGFCTIPSISDKIVDGVTYKAIPLSDTDYNILNTNNLWNRISLICYKNWTSMKYKVKLDASSKLLMYRIYNNANGDTPVSGSGDKITIENIPTALALNNSQETFNRGTFYYDADGYLYYKASANETVNNIQIPQIQGRMMEIYSPVYFLNVKFRGCGYEFFDTDYACSDTQGGYGIDGCIAIYGNGCSFLGCEFCDIEQHCVKFMNGSSFGSIENCYFHNVGCAAFMIGELDKKASNLPKYISITNNLIISTGEQHAMSCAAIMSFADHCRIDHNTISLCPYSAITAGHVWTSVDSDPETSYNNCSISYNIINRIGCKYVTDMGGIYNLGDTKGLKILGNKIFNCNESNGIYLDNGSGNITVEDNEIWNVGESGVMVGRTLKNITISHNLIANAGTVAFFMWQPQENININISGNICHQKTTTTFNVLQYSNFHVNNNLWWSTSGTINPATEDSTPVVGDPYFVDAKNGNFAYNSKVNVDKIGWVDIVINWGCLKSAKDNISNYQLDIDKFDQIWFA